VFFFQAEDGIRDFHVTGVQTCGLPISVFLMAAFGFATVSPIQKLVMDRASHAGAPTIAASVNIGMFNLGNAIGAWAGGATIAARSEERRVGKGGGRRGAARREETSNRR